MTIGRATQSKTTDAPIPCTGVNIWAQYCAYRLARGELTASSVEVISALLRKWHRYAGPLNEWTGDQAAAWVNDQRLRPSTRKSRLGKLRPYCRWLVKQGLLDADITEEIASIKVPMGPPRDLSIDEVRSLIAACPDERAVLIVLLQVQCGLRVGDVARIRRHDIDARRRLLHVRGKGGRGEVTHTVPIPDELWQRVLAALRSASGGGPLIASYHDGSALTPHHIGTLVRRWMIEAGLKAFAGDGISAHSLRHSTAQHLLDSGVSIELIQKQLGHTTVRSTHIYTRREPAGLRDAVNGRHYAA